MSEQIEIASEILDSLAESFAAAGRSFDVTPARLDLGPFVGAGQLDQAAGDLADDWAAWRPSAADAFREMRVAVLLISSWFEQQDAALAAD